MNTNPLLSSPQAARDHARSMHATRVPAMQTLPAHEAADLPEDIDRSKLLWDQTLGAGDYTARVIKRGTRLRLINTLGDACAQIILFNADRTSERLNIPDTLKVQWNAYIGQSKMLLSDMGRVLMSITADTSANHDTLCGNSTEWSNRKRYGSGENYSPHPNARDRFLLALLKHDMGRRDVVQGINLFKHVRASEDGTLHFDARSELPTDSPGTFVEMRAEMNVLIVITNCPHVLDPRPAYTATPLRLLAWRGDVTCIDDPVRNASPENQRAFENVEDYFLA